MLPTLLKAIVVRKDAYPPLTSESATHFALLEEMRRWWVKWVEKKEKRKRKRERERKGVWKVRKKKKMGEWRENKKKKWERRLVKKENGEMMKF